MDSWLGLEMNLAGVVGVKVSTWVICYVFQIPTKIEI